MPAQKSFWSGLIRTQLESRLEALRTELLQLDESKGSATKSSAGDKHETGRAMMEQELVRIQAQTEVARKQLNELLQMPSTDSAVAAFGAAVRTKNGIYFLSVPLGRVQGTEDALFAISAGSPLGQVLLGKMAGASVSFRGNLFEILEVL